MGEGKGEGFGRTERISISLCGLALRGSGLVCGLAQSCSAKRVPLLAVRFTERTGHSIAEDYHCRLRRSQLLFKFLESFSELIKIKTGPRCSRRRVRAPAKIAEGNLTLGGLAQEPLLDVPIDLLALDECVTQEHDPIPVAEL